MSTNEPTRTATGSQIAKGAVWLMLFKLADKGIGLISTLVLARLLVPADFGLVALAMAVVQFTQLMSAFGFDSALIQRQDASRPHYDTAWTFNVIFGVAMALSLWALAFPVASFYSDERLKGILLVLGLGALAGGFENIGTVAFRKQLDFRSEFRFLFLKRIASFIVTVGLAFLLRSYWALIAGVVTGRLLSVWISYRLHPFRPRLSLSARGELMHFSKWIFLSSVIGFFSNKSIDFILGRTVGTHGLGLYSVSYEIAAMPSTELIAPLNRAVYPAYAILAGDSVQLRARFLQVFGVICLIAFPVAGGMFAVADAAVRTVLGPQWLDTIPLIRIIALCGLIGALQSNLYLVIVAMGKPQANTLLSALLLVLTLPLTIWASFNYGVVGAAYALLFHSILAIAGISIIFARITKIGVKYLLDAGWRPFIVSAVMTVAVLWLDDVLVKSYPVTGNVARLLILCSCGAAIYSVSAWSLWKLCGAPQGAERLIFDKVVERVAALLRRPKAN